MQSNSKTDTSPEVQVTSSLLIGMESGFELPDKQKKKLFQLITISDNGIGLEQQYAEKIFKVFQRLHGMAEYKGTGVGLSIVQKVVDNHQGYVKAESELGKGATFKNLVAIPGQVESSIDKKADQINPLSDRLFECKKLMAY